MEPLILSLNGGSSSLKFAVYRFSDAAEERIFSGAVEGIGQSAARHGCAAEIRRCKKRAANFPTIQPPSRLMFAALHKQGVEKLAAAGHRIVHGGPKFIAPQLIDEKLKAGLKELIPFAPLHLPSQVAMIEAVAAHFPDLPQVACFDTAFHSGMPEVAQRFALPQELWEQGIRRYGFHGLSYEYVVGKLGPELGAARHHCPSWQRGQHGGAERWLTHGYQHGPDSNRRIHDGNAQWRP